MGMISPIPIGRVFVGQEPDDDDIHSLAASGFRSIVCVARPAGDAAPAPDAEKAAAAAAGLAFLRITLPAEGISAAPVRAFRESVLILPGPVYVHCGFGDRAAALALAAECTRLADPAGKIAELEARGIRLPASLRADVAQVRADECVDDAAARRPVRRGEPVRGDRGARERASPWHPDGMLFRSGGEVGTPALALRANTR